MGDLKQVQRCNGTFRKAKNLAAKPKQQNKKNKGQGAEEECEEVRTREKGP